MGRQQNVAGGRTDTRIDNVRCAVARGDAVEGAQSRAYRPRYVGPVRNLRGLAPCAARSIGVPQVAVDEAHEVGVTRFIDCELWVDELGNARTRQGYAAGEIPRRRPGASVIGDDVDIATSGE
jgi:hypothetical protein